MAPFARNQTCLKMIMFALFSLLWFVPSLSANVFIGSSLLPRSGSQFALGYSNDVIKLYGSSQTIKQFMSFNVSTQTFTDHGSQFLSTFINGGGQFYAQLANALYVINPNDNADTQYIAYFDLTTDAFTPSSIPIPIKVAENSCIGAHTNFLAIVGGGIYMSALYLYDLIGHQWSQPADLTNGRAYHSCIVHHESSRFYVLGGVDGPSTSSLNIETYHNSNPSVFTPLTSELLNPVWGARIVVYGDDIYVVGGYDVQSAQYAMRIQIIDTVQQTVRYGPSLAYGIRGAPVVIVNDILHCFGGRAENIYVRNTWQYLNLIPTVNPTENPTVHPTVNPSNNPSINPSNNPSINPTNNPSINPSNNPSINPTNNPSINPTNNPTLNPSINPTVNPSLYPTTHPTINATNAAVRHVQVHEVTTTLHAHEVTTGTQLTISIIIRSCSACNITENVMNEILIAHLDPDVAIVSVVMVDNTFDVIVSIPDDIKLDKDVLRNGILTELEKKHDNVDIELTIEGNVHEPLKPEATNDTLVVLFVMILPAIVLVILLRVAIQLWYKKKQKAPDIMMGISCGSVSERDQQTTTTCTSTGIRTSTPKQTTNTRTGAETVHYEHETSNEEQREEGNDMDHDEMYADAEGESQSHESLYNGCVCEPAGGNTAGGDTAGGDTAGGDTAGVGPDQGTCVDCGLMKPGKVFKDSGYFYCNECWILYD